jgi:hypothetical protein
MEASDIERGITKAASFDQGLTMTGPFNVLLLGEFGFFCHTYLIHFPVQALVLTFLCCLRFLSLLSILSFVLSLGRRAGKTSLAERVVYGRSPKDSTPAPTHGHHWTGVGVDLVDGPHVVVDLWDTGQFIAHGPSCRVSCVVCVVCVVRRASCAKRPHSDSAAGEEQFNGGSFMNPNYFRRTHALIMAYDIASPDAERQYSHRGTSPFGIWLGCSQTNVIVPNAPTKGSRLGLACGEAM